MKKAQNHGLEFHHLEQNKDRKYQKRNKENLKTLKGKLTLIILVQNDRRMFSNYIILLMIFFDFKQNIK